MRTYKDQFAASVVARIGAVIEQLESIQYPSGPARYYALDLAMCLHAGALVGSLVLSTALLELYVRGLVVHYSNIAQAGWSRPIDAQGELEAMRSMSFGSLVDHLASFGLFRPIDAENAKNLYKQVRIPLHHGLTARYVNTEQDPYLKEFRSIMRCSTNVSQREFEDVIEQEALPAIEKVVLVLQNNQFISHA